MGIGLVQQGKNMLAKELDFIKIVATIYMNWSSCLQTKKTKT